MAYAYYKASRPRKTPWEARLATDPVEYIESAVYLGDQDEPTQVGSTALQKTRPTDTERLFTKFKLDMGKTGSLLPEKYHKLDVEPEGLAAIIINKLRTLALANPSFQNNQLEFSGICVSVPSAWSPSSVEATRKAVMVAGFDNISIDPVPEPEAALYFVWDYDPNLLSEKDKKVMVVDFGGGTCDVAILQTKKTTFLPDDKAKLLHPTLQPYFIGGKNIDDAIVEFFYREFQKEPHQIPLEVLDRNKVYLEHKAEHFKIEATKHFRADAGKPFDYTDFSLEGRSLAVSVRNIADFNRIIYQVVNQIRSPIQEVLTRNGLLAQDIDFAILVGGSSSLPLVRTIVADEIKKNEAAVLVRNPSTAIAFGAALCKAYEKSNTPFTSQPLPRTISLTCAKKPFIIAKRGTDLTRYKPRRKIFETIEDGLSDVRIEIREGEKENASYFDHRVLEFGNPVPKGTKIAMSISINRYGVLDLKAIYEKNPNKNISINKEISLSPANIQATRKKYQIDGGHDGEN